MAPAGPLAARRAAMPAGAVLTAASVAVALLLLLWREGNNGPANSSAGTLMPGGRASQGSPNTAGASEQPFATGGGELAAGCDGLAGAPRAVRAACGVFRSDAREHLQRFFAGRARGGAGAAAAASAPSTVRLAFVDAERRHAGKTMETSHCAFRYNQTLARHGGAPRSDYAQKFAAELLVPRGLRRLASGAGRVVLASGVADADYVLVELCNIGNANSGHTLRELAPWMASVADEEAVVGAVGGEGGDAAGRRGAALKRAWRERRDRFLLVLTGDHGPCIQSNEKAGQLKRRQWIDEAVRGATMVMNEGSRQGGCYNPAADLVVPTTAVAAEEGPLRCPRPAAPGNRRPLVFFAGKLDSLVRREVAKRFAGHPDMLMPKGLSGNGYLCAMARSVFCLAPRGNAAWSPRLDEALRAGCIPVLLADAYDPPFSGSLNYSAFSVALPEGDFGSLVDTLAAVPKDRRRAMRVAGAAVRPFFRWRSLVGAAGGGGEGGPGGGDGAEASGNDGHGGGDDDMDANTMIAFELWRRLQPDFRLPPTTPL